MDLRQLEYLLKVAARKSITAAASELNITQPSLTKSIRQLERELNVKLLERLPRGVELTEYGKSLVRHAGRIQVQLKDAMSELEGLKGGDSGFVAIGAGPAWLGHHLPTALAQALASRPGLRVQVREGFVESVIKLLRAGEIDFALAELPDQKSATDLRLMALTGDDLGVVCRREHPLARRNLVQPEDLLDFPWVMPRGANRTQQRLEALMMALDIQVPEPVIQTDSTTLMLAMLRRGDNLTFTRSSTVLLPEGEGLTLLKVRGLTARRMAGVIHRRDSALSPSARAIVEELRIVSNREPRN